MFVHLDCLPAECVQAAMLNGAECRAQFDQLIARHFEVCDEFDGKFIIVGLAAHFSSVVQLPSHTFMNTR